MKLLLTVLWCGWILWAVSAKTDGADHFSDFVGPMAVDGYASLADCNAARLRGHEEQEKRLSAPGAKVVTHYETTWRCFPSDFDPRERRP